MAYTVIVWKSGRLHALLVLLNANVIILTFSCTESYNLIILAWKNIIWMVTLFKKCNLNDTLLNMRGIKHVEAIHKYRHFTTRETVGCERVWRSNQLQTGPRYATNDRSHVKEILTKKYLTLHYTY